MDLIVDFARLLGLRVLTLFGLVAAIMYFEVVGGLRVYDLAMFIVSTPVVWIAGIRIYKGAFTYRLETET